MIRVGVYSEGRTHRFANRVDVGHEREEPGSSKAAGPECWKNVADISENGIGAYQTSKWGCPVGSMEVRAAMRTQMCTAQSSDHQPLVALEAENEIKYKMQFHS